MEKPLEKRVMRCNSLTCNDSIRNFNYIRSRNLFYVRKDIYECRECKTQKVYAIYRFNPIKNGAI